MVGKHVIIRWTVVALVVGVSMYYGFHLVSESNTHQHPQLTVFGPRNDDGSTHKIADFKLMDQDGNTVTNETFKDKIYIADFIFTTCEGICPIMSDQMERVYQNYKGNPKVNFLSHTVKPEEDSLPALKKYAELHGADTKQWKFVTADKKQIYELARTSYMVSVSEGDGGPEDFVHTQMFALIDQNKQIRGFYDGTDSTEVSKLINDIGILME